MDSSPLDTPFVETSNNIWRPPPESTTSGTWCPMWVWMPNPPQPVEPHTINYGQTQALPCTSFQPISPCPNTQHTRKDQLFHPTATRGAFTRVIRTDLTNWDYPGPNTPPDLPTRPSNASFKFDAGPSTSSAWYRT